MLSQQQLDDLLYQMSSFYRDYLPNDNTLMKLFNAYSQTIDYLWTMYGEANDSKFVSTSRTASTIPYYKVNIDDAMYSLEMAQTISRMNSFESQISYLDNQKLYASFVFTTKDNSGDPAIMGLRLFTDFEGTVPLKLYQDYFIRSNRLYLLPGYILGRTQTLHYLHAFDLKINDNTLEKNFGTLFSLNAGTLVPRYEYRDIIESFTRVFQGQMSIKSIRDGISLATKWEGFDVQDYKSPTISAAKLKLYQDYIISPLRFIVTLPETLIPDKINTNIVRTLLDEVKQAQTDYMVFFEIERNDDYSVPMKIYPKVHYQRGEEFYSDDEHSVNQITMDFMEYPLDVAGRYDSSYYYNFNMQYDDPPSDEVISLQSYSKQLIDDGQIPDTVTVTHYTLMIPRQFADTIDSTTHVITFTMNPNQDATTQFEVHASSDLNGTYHLVGTVANDKLASTITLTYDSTNTGMFYYKGRSTDGTDFSCFTLPTSAGLQKLFDDADMMDDTYALDDTYAFDSTQDEESFISYLLGVPIHEGIS